MSIKISPLKKPIKAEVSVPGSKSYTNRALLLGAMTKNSVTIANPLFSDDTKAMAQNLQTLGITIEVLDDSIRVIGSIEDIKDGYYDLDANLSGTAIRFLLALSAIIPGVKTLHGKEGLNNRPIEHLVEGLRQLGLKIEYLDKEGFPPLRVLSSKLKSGTVKMNGEISSQYLSAILMIAPIVGEIAIEVKGKQISKPYIDMTIDSMQQFGVRVSNQDYKRYIIPRGQKYNLTWYHVEGDVSSASYFFAIAALTKSTLTLKNLNPKSVQADMKFLKILKDLGNKIIYKKDRITIIGKGVKPVSVDMRDCPDQVQTLAVLAAFAKGVTRIVGIQSLRVKETERVKALQTELKKMGVRTKSSNDKLIIYGGHPKPSIINTYGDHRMAMSFAVAAAFLSGMEINDPDVVNKTFPDFWKKLNSVGIKTELVNSKNIVLIGMRGSGKTTVAKLLAQKLNKEYLELDDILVGKVGMTIPEIVEKHGWDYFRDKESEIVQEVSLYQDKVISTGGGIVIRPQNIEALKKNGVLVLLKAQIETLLSRIGNDANRPFLTNKKTRREEIEELLKQRKKLYEQASNEIIDTDNLYAKEVMNKILLKMEGRYL